MKFKHKLIRFLNIVGLGFMEPVVLLVTGEEPKAQLPKIVKFIVMPALAILAFLGIWTAVAMNIKTNYGTVPTPSDTLAAAKDLWHEHVESKRKESEYYAEAKQKAEQYEAKAVEFRKAGKEASAEKMEKFAQKQLDKRYSASPTFIDQIYTSLQTVFTGFLIASAIAIPVGILCGLSPVFNASMLPFIQIFKPVSPLAWLPIVFILVGALYTTAPEDAWFTKAFLSSSITVAMCSLWPTLSNTALGVASIDKDHMNVARVLKLGTFDRIVKIIIPSSLPLMFAGLRISLGVGWMVLVAADMLAQNPGLGKFVWDMFQNGSSQTMSMIFVAVFTIGFIGLLLDRIMIIMQKLVSFDAAVAA
ncbi:ABC transporter permease [Calycomorphotria hydatis]|uniref:Bicarbonate transport system permease protein CmpB n=1 Tax=Calycomorphotria hydatis TaxID=2528027 RepID=A0A517T9Z8_9PLAN|nr:ABC transporter permease [Calycomorphotria hydatis]QDT65196.1 Bicarbonate transport system permease protein CmpB [Calycomorphotria hydatis]